MKIGRILGIDVRIHWSWFLMVALFAWSAAGGILPKAVPGQESYLYWIFGVFASLMVFFSVFLHELCHSMLAKIYRIPIRSITLLFWGGAAEINPDFRKPKVEFLIAIVGPLSSAVLAGLLFLIVKSGVITSFSLLSASFAWLVEINLILAVFNLVPLFPMDGGRVLRSILWWRTKNLVKATGIAMRVGIIIGIFLIVALYLFWGGLLSALMMAFLLFFFLIPASMAEYKMAVDKERSR